MREPCEGKLSRTVLRRGGARKGSNLSDTVGKNAKKIQEYIQQQLQEDKLNDQLTLNEYIDPFTGEPGKKSKK